MCVSAMWASIENKEVEKSSLKQSISGAAIPYLESVGAARIAQGLWYWFGEAFFEGLWNAWRMQRKRVAFDS